MEKNVDTNPENTNNSFMEQQAKLAGMSVRAFTRASDMGGFWSKNGISDMISISKSYLDMLHPGPTTPIVSGYTTQEQELNESAKHLIERTEDYAILGPDYVSRDLEKRANTWINTEWTYEKVDLFVKRHFEIYGDEDLYK